MTHWPVAGLVGRWQVDHSVNRWASGPAGRYFMVGWPEIQSTSLISTYDVNFRRTIKVAFRSGRGRKKKTTSLKILKLDYHVNLLHTTNVLFYRGRQKIKFHLYNVTYHVDFPHGINVAFCRGGAA